ncbi:O-antigen ligase family protein [Flavobacterium paronense]|uniref:O-antigen ligase family protein n=1 Tax=Flavobacterium paronense TaxID=1392775 RepID=A0ABV5GEP8_9FLAO|nr:O-antigen ligase family protein [Flavobacterium paronense]MDN3678426.1 O-antigen ligase family protein [Flavobacterium paronense]
MVNIYNFSKRVIQNLIKENKSNSSFISILLVLITIPLSFAINNISLGIFLLVAFITLKKENFKLQKELLFPILLYVLMVISYFWSIDSEETISALSKEIPLLIIPLGFLIFKTNTSEQKRKIIEYYSYAIVAFVLYYLVRAIIRYCMFGDPRMFFYHGENDNDYGLVPKLLNAIHMSVFVAVAFFYFFTKEVKSKMDNLFSVLLFAFILLLSSKNIILVVLLLSLLNIFFFSKTAHKLRLRNLIVFGLLLVIIFSTGRIKDRFKVEFQNNTDKSLSTNVIEGIPSGVHYVSLKEAWSNPTFTPNDYFNGTAFRVYQFRIFTELMNENNVFLKGFGLNASYPKIKEKAVHYNLYMGNENDSDSGYQSKNFHNQYVQNFAELGVFGFILLLILLIVNIKNAIKLKDFVHFAFAFLMISLFLTESFLWRQRGVVFFMMMYCLFNTGISTQNSSKAE